MVPSRQPDGRLSRITTPTGRLEPFGSPPPRIVNGQVVINRERGQEETNLSVSPDGTVVFGYVACPTTPNEPTTAPRADPAAPNSSTGGGWASDSRHPTGRAAQPADPTAPGTI